MASPYRVQLQLQHAGLPDGPAWLYEVKLDGYRAQIRET